MRVNSVPQEGEVIAYSIEESPKIEGVLGDEEESVGLDTDIQIIGEVTEEHYEKVLIKMMKLEEAERPINLYMNTNGGDTYVALAIGAFLDRSKVPVRVHLFGEVYSAGMLIAMGGYNNPNVRTYATKYTIGLVHSGSIGFSELPIDMFRSAYEAHIEMFQPLLKNYIKEHSKTPDDVIEEMLQKDYYMLSDTMLEYGIVDEII